MDLPDKIGKQIVLQASISRVWQAIADSRQFGMWFGISLDGSFVPGQTIVGNFNQTFNEEAIMNHQKRLGLQPSKIRVPGKNFTFCTVEKMEPEKYFSFRWIPYGIDADSDPENEPKTLVEFDLEQTPEGTRLRITESGFNKVPAHRRERAFRMNDGGWTAQAANIKAYVEA